MRNLGLIGGLGPAATIHYYRKLVQYPCGEALILSADIDTVFQYVGAGDRDGLAAYLARLIDRLASGGAEVAAISAITPHFAIRELERISALPIVSVVDVIRSEIRARAYQRVALFGTRFVVESALFGMLGDVEVVTPGDIEMIHKAYMQIVAGDAGGKRILVELGRSLPVDAVVLAGTDLSVVFDQGNADFVQIDSAELHIQAIGEALHAAT